MHNHPHPDSEQLDMLRAGLLDDSPSDKRAIEQHLAACADCRAVAGIWQQITTLVEPTIDPNGLQDALRHARLVAVKPVVRRTRRSYAQYAVAASLLAAVAAGFYALPTARTTLTPVTSNQTAQVIPDTYEDLDFYLWLASQDESHPGKQTANPNKS